MKVLSVVSGGPDSITAAAQYKDEDQTLLTFNYGQKGSKEMEAARGFAEEWGSEFKEVDISFMKELYGDSNQLTSDEVEVERDYEPSVVVPLRNGVLLEIAMAYAYSEGFDKVTFGSHLDDAVEYEPGKRHYPDCSPEFFKSMELANELGSKSGETVEVESPSTLGWRKSKVLEVGKEILGDRIYDTWSCYFSREKHCGNCEACVNRKKGFLESEIEDRTEYEEPGLTEEERKEVLES